MKKQITLATCVVLICTCLFGCGNRQPGRADSDIVKNTMAYGINAKETINPGNETRIQHITRELGGNLFLDADVMIPVKNEYSTYTLKMVDCSPDRLFDLFCPEGHGSFTPENHATCIVYHESSGKRLVVYEDMIDYSTYNFSTEERPMQDVGTLMYYYSLDYPQAVPHDLSFMNVEDMETFGRDLLTRLGISWEPKLLRCVTLSGQEILDFQEDLLVNGDNAYLRTPTTLTEATDTCYLQFDFTYDGISLIGLEEPTAFSDENFDSSPQVYASPHS